LFATKCAFLAAVDKNMTSHPTRPLFRLTALAGAMAAAWALVPGPAHAAPAEATSADTAHAAPAERASHRFHEDHVLGTSLDVVAVTPDAAQARRALLAVRAEIARLDALLSGWRADSELSRLNRLHAPTKVSPELWQVISTAEDWRTTTGGAFSGRLGAVIEQWRRAGSSGELPDAGLLQRLAAQAQAAGLVLDAAQLSVTRPEGVVFALDAVAKGYIVDAAVRAAQAAEPGLAGLLIDIGGDVRCYGCAPRAEGWRIGVAPAGEPADNAPAAATVRLRGGEAIATSGRGARDLTVAGRPLSHTLSPQSGQPVDTEVHGATVIAANAADADALATAFSVMPVDQALALADRLEGVAVLLQAADGRQWASQRWARHAVADDAPRFVRAAANDATEAPWPAGFSASIAYEVPRIASESYRAPYVTLWITDENKQLVRTLLVLGADPKWIDSNYIWWRRYGRKMQALDTIAKPTRQPGRYSLVWDGLDDAGQRVGQGRYIVHVEASREHGTHTYQSFDIELGAKPAEKSLPAKEEMGGVRLVYGRGS
jgi:thiamine biosynthesis lipoprotein